MPMLRSQANDDDVVYTYTLDVMLNDLANSYKKCKKLHIMQCVQCVGMCSKYWLQN